MKLRTKLVSAALIFSMAVCLTSNVCGVILSGFIQQNTYGDYTYVDVSPDDWYYYYVGFAYEYGIMTGTADGVFSPGGKLTVAEAITVAARLNAAYYGNTIDMSAGGHVSAAALDDTEHYSYPATGDAGFGTGADVDGGAKIGHYVRADALGAVTHSLTDMTWFTPYLKYVAGQGIIYENQFSGRYTEPATRSELAYLLYRALPSCYSKINSITPIPDVPQGSSYQFEILSLYEAGVITGNDEYGTFYPRSSIVRSEVAAMVSRAVNSDLRVKFSLNPNIPMKPLFFSWRYPSYGAEYSINLQISYYDYNYFNSKRRFYNYTEYATDSADVGGLTALADELRNMAARSGYTSAYDIAGFITAFVQSIEYMDDMATKGVAEYPKYPIETLFEQGGDCEDKAVLLAKLLKLLGYGSVLLVSSDHMAVGLQTSGSGNLSYDGADYYYIETTEPGWRVGEVPGDMLGIGMEVLYI